MNRWKNGGGDVDDTWERWQNDGGDTRDADDTWDADEWWGTWRYLDQVNACR